MFNKMFSSGVVLVLSVLSKNYQKEESGSQNNVKFEIMSEVKWLNSDNNFIE